MSYILDALKKSDLQRQRGATPTLTVAQLSVATPQRIRPLHYGLLAAVLLGAGITIGWLRPWQMETTPKAQEAVAGPATSAQSETPQFSSAPHNLNGRPLPSPVIASVPPAVQPLPAEVAPERGAIPLHELPAAIQQELPAMEVQLHAYSNDPGERLVSINSIRLREGGMLMSGLRLEAITPNGMVFTYKGYRFERGVR